jgi:hypothetical protein
LKETFSSPFAPYKDRFGRETYLGMENALVAVNFLDSQAFSPDHAMSKRLRLFLMAVFDVFMHLCRSPLGLHIADCYLGSDEKDLGFILTGHGLYPTFGRNFLQACDNDLVYVHCADYVVVRAKRDVKKGAFVTRTAHLHPIERTKEDRVVIFGL